MSLVGLLIGLASGALSVYSLWLITGFAAQAARGLTPTEKSERPTGWDAEAQDPDVATAGQWWKREESPGAISTKMAQGELRGATLRLFFAFLLKAPILVAIAAVAQSLGKSALYWCVGGVVSVYSVAVFWAATRTHRR